MNNLQPFLAITNLCHKIQGGENDCVIINSLDFNRCRDRKVLEQLRYVGATRAKRALVVLK